MGKVVQDNTRSPISTDLVAGSGVPARAEVSTVAVTPLPISPVRADKKIVAAAAISALGNGIATIANQQAQITFKKQQIQQQQAQQVAQAQARSDLLNTVDQVVNDAQAATGDPFQFNADGARDSARSAVFNFISGPDGMLINNDTLRLALDEADARIAALEPKTTVKLKEGFNIITQILDGRVETTSVPVDPDQILFNALGSWTSVHPNLARSIADDPDMTDAQKIQAGKRITDKLAMIEEISIQLKTKNALNPRINLPEPVRKAEARSEFLKLFIAHGETELSEMLNKPTFNKDTPGALNRLAQQYKVTMTNMPTVEPAAAEISAMYGIDVVGLVGPQMQRVIDAKVEWIESLDRLSVDKVSAESAVAKATAARNRLILEDTRLQQSIPAGTRLAQRLAGANFDIYMRMFRASGQSNVNTRLLVLSMDVANSRFEAMNFNIAELPDDDEPRTRKGVQAILSVFAKDVNAWVDRDYLSSADVVGFVSTFQLLQEKGTYQRLEPEAWSQIERLYQKAKSNPEHTNIFNVIEKGESLSREQLSAMREAITFSTPLGGL